MWGDCDRTVCKGLQFQDSLTPDSGSDHHENVAIP